MFEQLKKKYYRWKAKRQLISRYAYLHEVDTLLEEYITGKILEGGSEEFLAKGRKNLITKQQEILENSKFLDFLKK